MFAAICFSISTVALFATGQMMAGWIMGAAASVAWANVGDDDYRR